MSRVLALTKTLISNPSVTPRDCDCQALLTGALQALDFNIEHLPFEDVSNFWATRGTGRPSLVFAGHTDVVPTGPEADWSFPPFTPTLRGDLLYGRGAADMKSALAAMIVATERFIEKHPDHAGQIGFLITSDEEGAARHGTRQVVEVLRQRGITPDYCLVGEPSSDKRLGDTVKVGRRGSHNGILTIYGKQGHIAYPHLADNPIHRALGALQQLTETQWDQGNSHFPPTSLQISNIQAGTGANNVIPGSMTVTFNFRFSPEVTHDALQQRFEAVLDEENLKYDIDWRLSGEPFYTAPGPLTEAVTRAVQAHTGHPPVLSTVGGTSDGRFIATLGTDVVELGVMNETIHQVDECVSISDLEKLTDIYEQLLVELLMP